MKRDYSVAVIDDHLLFAKILERLINTFDMFTALYAVRTIDEFIDTLKRGEMIPDIVIIDIKKTLQLKSIETIQSLKINYPSLKVLVLAMDFDENVIIKVLQAGAKGYLSKDINPSILQDALIDVIEKGFYYSDRVRNILFNSIYNDSPDVILKEREIEFLKQVCTEKTYKEIAHEMFLSPKTIDGYREALFEKLRIKSRVGLAIYAIKNKLYKVE